MTDSSKAYGLKILAVSDFEDPDLKERVRKNQQEKPDLILSAGDLPPEYLTFLRQGLDAPLFYVKGNHDIRYTLTNPMGCEDIHGRVVKAGPLNILGIEGSMWYNDGPNQYTEAMMKKKLFWIKMKTWSRRPVDIIVTHAPPRHVHDREDRCHMGFQCFHPLIGTLAPQWFIHGHIHDAFDRFDDRITVLKQTRVMNTCGHTFFEV